MKSTGFIIFLLIIVLIINTLCTIADEREDLNDEIQQLKQMMKEMQNRLDNLESRNKDLEEKLELKNDEAESMVSTAESSPVDGGYIQRVIQSLNPDISAIGIFSAAYFSQDDPLQGAENDPDATGIDLQELELAFSGSIDPYFRVDSYFSLSKDSIEAEEAFATTLTTLPLNSQFRIGIMRSKFGRINTQHRHVQDFVTLPLVVNSFLGEHLHPAAFEANFLLPLPWFAEFSAAVGIPSDESPSFNTDDIGNDVGLLLYVFHLSNFFEVSNSLSLNIGGSFATGANGTGRDNRTNLYGTDFFAKYRPLRNSPYQEILLQSEFMYRDEETDEGNLDEYGFYIQLVYRFAKRWNTGLRFGLVNPVDPVEADESFTEAEIMNNDPVFTKSNNGENGINDLSELGLLGLEYRISAMLTFNPSEFSRIRLEYDYTHPDPGFADSQSALYLQFQYSLGAHGAHPY